MDNYIVESVQQAIFLREPPQLDTLKLWDLAFDVSPSGFQ